MLFPLIFTLFAVSVSALEPCGTSYMKLNSVCYQPMGGGFRRGNVVISNFNIGGRVSAPAGYEECECAQRQVYSNYYNLPLQQSAEGSEEAKQTQGTQESENTTATPVSTVNPKDDEAAKSWVSTHGATTGCIIGAILLLIILVVLALKARHFISHNHGGLNNGMNVI